MQSAGERALAAGSSNDGRGRLFIRSDDALYAIGR
jgi:hypothetical protein